MKFDFEVQDAISFPPGKAANILRGALGMTLPPDLFSPRGEGPSGFRDSPRPFVLRAPEIQDRCFTLRINSFKPDLFASFRYAVEQLKTLGPRQTPIRLMGAVELPAAAIDLIPMSAKTNSIRLDFLTPMELKHEDKILREPRFDAIFPRVRDRVSSLCELYQGGAPDVDYRALGERAKAVTMKNSHLEQVDIERHSSRTGQRHGIGGFTGYAEYAGDLAEFMPWLAAAQWTGVGRHTVWGNGALRVTDISADHVPFQHDIRS